MTLYATPLGRNGPLGITEGFRDADGILHGTVDGIETLLTAIQGATWSTETLVAIKAAIDAIIERIYSSLFSQANIAPKVQA
jgi:hypothetical protein